MTEIENNIKKNADIFNNRIFNRYKPEGVNEFKFDPRPVSTKYDIMPIYDRHVKSNVSVKNKPYDVNSSFYVGTDNGPFTGYVNNVDKESTLRNQFFALQQCQQSVYVPSSNSDMYNVNVKGTNLKQPYEDLFIKQNLGSFNPNPNIEKVGYNIFLNATRAQVKNL